ncbi:DUF1190 domain-containing protein [Pseudovibrio sp. FO-BEG1]|uniref:DUF1190 domain-containing protein n=1 Tax=Pseudovibrio sp. (strain FO-BEG1) TaxID=911045 RepID=UPI0005A012AC|nr:DUF1190 domain-containing protein [Pseudovibrio sp. FO-BEG1]
MKRSGPLKLVVMATAGISLAACDSVEEKADGKVFSDKQHCVSSEQYDINQCNVAFTVGEEINKMSAPRYNSQRLCEEQHGTLNCKAIFGDSSGPASYFVPFVAGYFIADATQKLTDWNYRVRPVYFDHKERNFYTSNGYLLDLGNSKRPARLNKKSTKKLPKVAKVQTRTSVASRGGFGSRSGRGFGG